MKPARYTETMVIGAGPAGTVAAANLKKAGHDVLIIEQEVFPRFSIGESLLPQCMDLLDEAGLLQDVHEQNYQKKSGAVFRRMNDKYGFDFGDQFTKSWGWTYQVPRDHFDHTLAKKVENMGVTILFGHNIATLERQGNMWKVTVRDSAGKMTVIETPFIMDASGYGHVLPRMLNLVKSHGMVTRTATFAHFDSDPGDPEMGRDTIVIGSHCEQPDIWYWTIPFSNGRVSVGVVTTPEFISKQGSSPSEQFRNMLAMEPNVKKRLENSVHIFEPRQISGYSHTVSNLHGEGYAILGHAGEFLDPIFSSGVTISLKSASLAASARGREINGEKIDWNHAYSNELLHGVRVFKTFVLGWYSGLLQSIIYNAVDDNHYSRQICSILAGYVWDRNNKIAVEHERSLPLLAAICAHR